MEYTFNLDACFLQSEYDYFLWNNIQLHWNQSGVKPSVVKAETNKQCRYILKKKKRTFLTV